MKASTCKQNYKFFIYKKQAKALNKVNLKLITDNYTILTKTK